MKPINLKPVNAERVKLLEERFGYCLCPFTVEVNLDSKTGILADDNAQRIFRCVGDNGQARGGTIGAVLGVAVTPCPQEYAKGCNIFKNYGHLLTLVYKDLGYGTNGQVSGSLEH